MSRPANGMGPVMRRLTAIASIAFAAGAWATGAGSTGAWAADYEPSDFPTLRGSNPYIPATPRHTNWGGFYAGGQAGYSASYMDFAKAGRSINAFDPNVSFTAPFGSVSSWASLGTDTGKAPTYGAFVGYNWQFDDLILGFEANYNHTSLFGTASATRCYTSSPSLPNCSAAITLGDGNDLQRDGHRHRIDAHHGLRHGATSCRLGRRQCVALCDDWPGGRTRRNQPLRHRDRNAGQSGPERVRRLRGPRAHSIRRCSPGAIRPVSAPTG